MTDGWDNPGWAESAREYAREREARERNQHSFNGQGTAMKSSPSIVPKLPIAKSRIELIPFEEIRLGTERRYLVKGLIPREGLTVIWGPPKSGKSFWMTDVALHVALNWPYRGRKVVGGPVVYCAFEGAFGFSARVEAFRQRHLAENADPVPFYLEPVTIDIIRDHPALIAAIRARLGDTAPVLVCLDTLNRSLAGSETDDMPHYVRAADVIRETFHCAVAIIHHCGVAGDRPRGHTSLTGAADAQLSVRRDSTNNIVVEVEHMKDGPEGEAVVNRLEPTTVGLDDDGDPITSCVVLPVDAPATSTKESKLSKNQQTMFGILHAMGTVGLTTEEWNKRAREAGLRCRSEGRSA
jgi:hypothetical protein